MPRTVLGDLHLLHNLHTHPVRWVLLLLRNRHRLRGIQILTVKSIPILSKKLIRKIQNNQRQIENPTPPKFFFLIKENDGKK